MKTYDKVHEKVLREGLFIFAALLQKKEYKGLSDAIFFTWWTSLLFKYQDFYRFSVDLDFSVDYKARVEGKKCSLLFDALKFWIEEYLRQAWEMVFESDNSREIYFVGEKGTRWIKIDWMYDLTLKSEDLIIDDITIQKASDYDIVLNKLMRLNKTDISDIQYILKQSTITTKEILKGLEKKWKHVHGNVDYLIHKSMHLREKKKKDLFILQDLLAWS